MDNHNNAIEFSAVYTTQQEELIQSEFTRLQGQHYLEHAGATLYSERQISDSLGDYNNNLYANPHARNSSSNLTDDSIDQIRYEILRLFNTNSEEYTVIFTSNATQALKIVAETFQYENEEIQVQHQIFEEKNQPKIKDLNQGKDKSLGTFSYLEDNHTSVLGMREYAPNIVPLPVEKALEMFSIKSFPETLKLSDSNSLFVYPAQSNFSGAKYPLSWIKKIREGILNRLHSTPSNWHCVVDAASYVSTSPLDLSQYKPDFIPISFYKIFGFPTGVGALLVKNSSAHLLRKQYFGGGTVFLALSSENVVVRRKVLYERFEDGSLPFLSILSLKHGFDTIKRLNLSMELISSHVFSLAQYVYWNLVSLHHSNGRPAAIVYSNTNFDSVERQGGIVNFNLLRSNGDYIGYAEVLHFANLINIHLRTGCFCNPGGCKFHLKLTTADIKHHFDQGHVCGDSHDLIDGHPTGSVRISFGYMSTKANADALLDMIEKCFISKPILRKYSPMLKATKPKVDKDKGEDPCQKSLDKINIYYPTDPKKQDITEKENGGTMKNLTRKISNRTGKKLIASNLIDKSSKLIDESATVGTLEHIFIYPIKSCGQFSIENSWDLVSTGLKYDRQWMIVNSSGVCMTQKRNTYMCLIKPIINLEKNMLELNFEGLPSISIPLNIRNSHFKFVDLCQSKVCGDRVQSWDCGDEVAEWLTEALNIEGLRLLRQCDNNEECSRTSKKGEKLSLSLSNQAQFLLINLASIQWLKDRIPPEEFDENIDGLILRFRPNFVVDFGEAFVEKQLNKCLVNDLEFEFDGNCHRCQMICIDQTTGDKSIEPLKTLSREFDGKISFGVYFRQTSCLGNSAISLKCQVLGF